MTRQPETTPPIDILAIAASRLSMAKEWLQCTRMMQAGPAAEIQFENALLKVYQAEADMSAARDLGQYLEDVTNAI